MPAAATAAGILVSSNLFRADASNSVSPQRESVNDTDAKTILLRNARVVLAERIIQHTILIADGYITRILEAAADEVVNADAIFDLNGLTLTPGFIDVHIHGAVGVDTLAASADELHKVARFLAREGVTAWLPTLVPAPDEDYARAVASIAQLMREQDERPPAARALGVHYEGPFVNHAQCGALRPIFFRTYHTPADVASLPRVKHEMAAHMITVAPEIEGGLELVRELTARGFVVSIGHTRADVATLDAAHAQGARHMTHFFNAMSPLHHRAPGPIGWGLTNDAVTCDIIADGVHTDPLMLRLALRCKSAARLLLISDAVAPTGLGDGNYELWGEQVAVVNGRTQNERGSIAGSVSTMRDSVRLLHTLGVAPPELARMTAHNPARLLGVHDVCGAIETGKRADLIALDDEGRVRFTLVGGRIAFSDL
jgi:N-acetylglucosamine-6-phosphate deacetylase